MKAAPLRTSLLAASLLAAFGVARAETTTTYISTVQLQPKCMDAANTKPLGCIPSIPAPGAGTASSSNGQDVATFNGAPSGTSRNASNTGMGSTSSGTSSSRGNAGVTSNANPNVNQDATSTGTGNTSGTPHSSGTGSSNDTTRRDRDTGSQ